MLPISLSIAIGLGIVRFLGYWLVRRTQVEVNLRLRMLAGKRVAIEGGPKTGLGRVKGERALTRRFCGGDDGTRTHDPLLAKQVL